MENNIQLNQNNDNEELDNLDTLDESIKTTLKRDFEEVLEKIKVSLFPFKAGNTTDKFKNWDFWGPLMLCLLLGFILSIGQSQSNGLVFVLIFFVVWVGGLLISLNSQFLGTNLSIFQCICILGYCMSSIVLAAFVNLFLGFVPAFIRLIVAMAGFGYSSYASFCFVGAMVPPTKKILVSYPIVLFYLFLAWFTLAK